MLHQCVFPVFDFSPVISCADKHGSPRKKIAVSTLALADDTPLSSNPVNGAQPLSQRKKLLKAPTLAELKSSDSDSEVSLYMCPVAKRDSGV